MKHISPVCDNTFSIIFAHTNTLSCISLWCVCLCMFDMPSLVCVCLHRLAEMESQNCSFFTDSLSPDESLWVCRRPHTANPLITTTALCRDYVRVFPLDTLIVSVFVCVLRLVNVCPNVRERLGNHINNQPHNENDPQREARTRFPFIIHTPAAIKVCGCVWVHEARVCVCGSWLNGGRWREVTAVRGIMIFDVNEAASPLWEKLKKWKECLFEIT